MAETIDLNWIGATLRTIQSEQRSLRTEQDILRKALSDAHRPTRPDQFCRSCDNDPF